MHVEVHQNTENYLAMDKLEVYEFELKKKGWGQLHNYTYGIGTFSNAEVDSFKTMVKGIYLRSENDSCLVEGEALNQFFPKKRKGYFKNILRISIHNCPKPIDE